jgi:hypothetical protein
MSAEDIISNEKWLELHFLIQLQHDAVVPWYGLQCTFACCSLFRLFPLHAKRGGKMANGILQQEPLLQSLPGDSDYYEEEHLMSTLLFGVWMPSLVH